MDSQLHLPKGWMRSGSAPDRYDMGVPAARAPAHIRSREARTDDQRSGFGTMMQSVAAARYRGKRLRFTAELRTEGVDGAGTIWMRIDGEKRSIRFDNMETRTADGVLKDTADWTRREVVLDVPPDAESIHYGFYLRGAGSTWARNFEFAEVGEDVAVTSPQPSLLDGPTNLDFADIAGTD